MRCALFCLLLFPALTGAQAQARPSCPTRPTHLAAMRSCYRPLLVFAPAASDARLREQTRTLDQAADDMMDRNMLLVASPSPSPLPLDAPYAVLAASELASLRRRFHIAPEAFVVILIGEDGGEKLRATAPVSQEKLNALIDTMPGRRREMQQPHSN